MTISSTLKNVRPHVGRISAPLCHDPADPKKPRTCHFCGTVEKFVEQRRLMGGNDTDGRYVLFHENETVSANFTKSYLKGMDICNACVAIMDEAGAKRERKLKAAEGKSTEKKWKVLFGD